MTYGWAILIIVIVAAVLYSLGIFNPSASVSATITGFSGLGVTQAGCVNSVNDQILELYVTNAAGYLVNITKINTSGNDGVDVSQNIGSVLGAGDSAVFYVNGACNKSSSSYSGSATITYTEPGEVFPGPYLSTGNIANVPVSPNPNEVGKFSGNNANIETTVSNIPIGASPRTVVAWIYTTNNTQNRAFFGYGIPSNYEDFYAAVGMACSGYGEIWVDAWGTCRGMPPQPLTPIWVFVAYLYNGTAEQAYSGYDGSLSGFAYGFYTFSTAYSPFYISDNTGYGGGFNGSVSNVQLYDTALSHADITRLYSEGLGGSPISNAGLLGWWPLDGNANDYSGNNHNGVASNVNWVSP